MSIFKQNKRKMKSSRKMATAPVASAVSGSTLSTQPIQKVVSHNKAFPVQKVSRTQMVNVINNTKGRFFTATHIDTNGQPRTMNAIKSNRPATELGYITVWSVQDKGYRNINPQTLTDVSFGRVHYKANRKPRA